MTEAELSKKSISIFSQNFDVLTERVSKCGLGRIDLVLICKHTRVKFGVELKSTERKRGEVVGDIVKQCMRYVKYEFMVEDGERKNDSKFEQLPIFLCPALSNNILAWVDSRKVIDGIEHIIDRHSTENPHHGINGMLGSFGVGEVRSFYWNNYKTGTKTKYYTFIMSNKDIWNAKPNYQTGKPKGLHQENYNKLLKKLSI